MLVSACQKRECHCVQSPCSPAFHFWNIFKGARLHRPASVLPLCRRETSPVAVLLRKYGSFLHDSGLGHWLPYLASTTEMDWTQLKLQTAACLHIKLMGHVHLRNFAPFLEWPWLLSALVDESCDPAERLRVADAVVRLQPCCIPSSDGLTLHIKSMFPSHEELQSARCTELLRDIMEHCPPTNVNIEDRFARGRRASHPSEGRPMMCSDHCLSEWASMAQTLRLQYSECPLR